MVKTKILLGGPTGNSPPKTAVDSPSLGASSLEPAPVIFFLILSRPLGIVIIYSLLPFICMRIDTYNRKQHYIYMVVITSLSPVSTRFVRLRNNIASVAKMPKLRLRQSGELPATLRLGGSFTAIPMYAAMYRARYISLNLSQEALSSGDEQLSDALPTMKDAVDSRSSKMFVNSGAVSPSRSHVLVADMPILQQPCYR